MTTIYNYSPITGEYINQSTADESPLEAGVFLIPANATDTAPPAARAGKARCYRDGAWVLVLDKRGTDYWLGTEKHTITELGEDIPSGASTTEPPAAPPTEAEQNAMATRAVEAYINTELATRHYEAGGATLANYALLTDAQIAAQTAAMQPVFTMFRVEAQAAQSWIVSVWAAMAAIGTGAIPRPATVEDLIAALPTMQWPAGSTPR